MFQGAGSNPVGSTAFPVLVGKVARRSRTGDLLKVTLTSPLNLTIIVLELDGFMPRAECGPGFCFFCTTFIGAAGTRANLEPRASTSQHDIGRRSRLQRRHGISRPAWRISRH